jgi:hypothetical protein
MNKLNFSNYPSGGWPLILDTLRHWHDGMYESFSRLLKGFDNNGGFGGQWIRLEGCQFTFSGGGNTLDVSDGYIMYIPIFALAPAEIHKVTAHTVTKLSGQYFTFNVTAGNEPVDPIYTVGGTPFSVHENTSAAAVMTLSSFLTITVSDENIPYLWNYLAGAWRNWSPSAGDFAVVTGSFTTPVAYQYKYRVKGKNVLLSATISGIIGATTSEIWLNLPNGLVVDGNFSGYGQFLEGVNRAGITVRAYDTETKVRISATNTLYLPSAAGAAAINFQIEFKIA